MKTSIELNRVRFYAYHGVMQQERKVGNDYEVSLRVDVPLQAAMASDDVADTLNYAHLYALVAREMAVPSALLEHVVGRIYKAIAEAYPAVTGGSLRVAKLSPPIVGEVGEAAVTIEW